MPWINMGLRAPAGVGTRAKPGGAPSAGFVPSAAGGGLPGQPAGAPVELPWNGSDR